MAISLAVFDFSVVWVSLIVSVIGVWRVLGVSNEVDGVGRCGETLLVERTGDKAGNMTPVALRLREYGACADCCLLSVVLLSAVPALARAYQGHPRCKRVRVLFVWFQTRVGCVPGYDLYLVQSETVWRVGVMWEGVLD